MRFAFLIVALFLVTEAAAQAPQQMLRDFQDVLSRFIPPQQPAEQPTDLAAPEDSAAVQRQALWDSAIKISSDDEEPGTGASPGATTSPHTQEECLDPAKFQPGQVGYLDYYLFKIADTGRKELYLEGEGLKDPFCLTGIEIETPEGEELYEKDQDVVILGYVRVRGTKVYETQSGEELKVRIVKLLSPEESEVADAQRAILETVHPVRTWTSKDGKHKLEARFLKFEGGKVHLVNSGGKNISISPNNLSTEDREYYRDLIKKAREAARKPAEEDDPAMTNGELESYR